MTYAVYGEGGGFNLDAGGWEIVYGGGGPDFSTDFAGYSSAVGESYTFLDSTNPAAAFTPIGTYSTTAVSTNTGGYAYLAGTNDYNASVTYSNATYGTNNTVGNSTGYSVAADQVVSADLVVSANQATDIDAQAAAASTALNAASALGKSAAGVPDLSGYFPGNDAFGGLTGAESNQVDKLLDDLYNQLPGVVGTADSVLKVVSISVQAAQVLDRYGDRLATPQRDDLQYLVDQGREIATLSQGLENILASAVNSLSNISRENDEFSYNEMSRLISAGAANTLDGLTPKEFAIAKALYPDLFNTLVSLEQYSPGGNPFAGADKFLPLPYNSGQVSPISDTRAAVDAAVANYISIYGSIDDATYNRIENAVLDARTVNQQNINADSYYYGPDGIKEDLRREGVIPQIRTSAQAVTDNNQVAELIDIVTEPKPGSDENLSTATLPGTDLAATRTTANLPDVVKTVIADEIKTYLNVDPGNTIENKIIDKAVNTVLSKVTGLNAIISVADGVKTLEQLTTQLTQENISLGRIAIDILRLVSPQVRLATNVIRLLDQTISSGIFSRFNENNPTILTPSQGGGTGQSAPITFTGGGGAARVVDDAGYPIGALESLVAIGSPGLISPGDAASVPTDILVPFIAGGGGDTEVDPDLVPDFTQTDTGLFVATEDLATQQNTTVGSRYTSVYNPETGTYDVVNLDTGETVESGLDAEEAAAAAEELSAGDPAYPEELGGGVPVDEVSLNAEDVTDDPFVQTEGGLYVLPEDLDPTNTGEEAFLLGQTQNARNQEAINTQNGQIQQGDWRVRLRLAEGADYLYRADQPGILMPLVDTDGVIFPYTPQISTTYGANYQNYDLTHSNYRGYFYQNSYVDAINIQATFTAQDTTEADYLLAVIHFFRSVTKMFYGQDANRGVPPPMVFLTGLGQYQFNNHPCLVRTFNYTLPTDVDYIRARTVNIDGSNLLKRRTRQSATQNPLSIIMQRLFNNGLTSGALEQTPDAPTLGTGSPTYVPTKIEIQLELLPVQSRQQVSQVFSLQKFATGQALRGGFW